MHMHALRRRLVIVAAAMAGAAGLFVALPASAQSNDGAVVLGNPTCAVIAPPGAVWTQLKVEPPEDGVFSDGAVNVNVDVRDSADGQVVDWGSNIGVDAVIVKGGPNANVYVYDAESTGDSGLHAPVIPSGQFAGLSHVLFCYDVEAVPPTPPPTTAPPPTTTPPTTSPTPTSTTSTTIVTPPA